MGGLPLAECSTNNLPTVRIRVFDYRNINLYKFSIYNML